MNTSSYVPAVHLQVLLREQWPKGTPPPWERYLQLPHVTLLLIPHCLLIAHYLWSACTTVTLHLCTHYLQ
jgi:hypothetical protein